MADDRPSHPPTPAQRPAWRLGAGLLLARSPRGSRDRRRAIPHAPRATASVTTARTPGCNATGSPSCGVGEFRFAHDRPGVREDLLGLLGRDGARLIPQQGGVNPIAAGSDQDGRSTTTTTTTGLNLAHVINARGAQSNATSTKKALAITPGISTGAPAAISSRRSICPDWGWQRYRGTTNVRLGSSQRSGARAGSAQFPTTRSSPAAAGTTSTPAV